MTTRHLTFGALAGVVSPVVASSNGPSIVFDAKAELRALKKMRQPQVAPSLQAALKSLRQEQDPELFWSDLLTLARDAKTDRSPEVALWLLAFLGEPHPTLPLAIQKQARQEFGAMMGGSPLGNRLEFLISRLPQEATDYRLIVPMIGGSLVGRVCQTGLLGHFVRSSPATWYHRGLSARFLAGFGGYLAEVPIFTAMARGLRHDATGVSPSLAKELAHSALTLGLLRTTHFLGTQTFLKTYNLSETALGLPAGWGLRMNHWLLPQAFSYGGLMAAHGVATYFHLQDHGPTANPWIDNLALLFSLGLGAHLGHRLLGTKFHAFNQALGKRAQIYTEQTYRSTSQTLPPLAMAMAGGIGNGPGPRNPRPEDGQRASGAKTQTIEQHPVDGLQKFSDLIKHLQSLNEIAQNHPERITPQLLSELATHLHHHVDGVSLASAIAIKNIILNSQGMRLTPAFTALFAGFSSKRPQLQEAILAHFCEIARDATARLTPRRLQRIFKIMDPGKMSPTQGRLREFLNHLMVLGNSQQTRWAQELMNVHGLAAKDVGVQRETLRLMEESISYLAPRLNPRTVRQLIRLVGESSEPLVAQDALQIYYYLIHHHPEHIHLSHLKELFSIANHHGDMETRKYALATLVAADQVRKDKLVPELLQDLAKQIMAEVPLATRVRTLETLAGLSLGQYEIPPEIFTAVLRTGLFHSENEVILDASVLLEKILARHPEKLTPHWGQEILDQAIQAENAMSLRAAARLLDRSGFPIGDYLRAEQLKPWVEQIQQRSDGDRIYGAAVLLGAATAAEPHHAMARSLFQFLGLKAIEFGDSGDGLSTTSLFMGAHIREPQAARKPASPFCSPVETRKVTSQDLPKLMAQWGAVGEAEHFGRTEVYSMRGSTDLLALKYRRFDQTERALSREILWLDAVEKSGLALKSELPKVYRDEIGQALILKLSQKKTAIPMRVPARYYDYLDNYPGKDADFMKGLTNSIHDVILLAGQGWFHLVPLRMFHNVEQPQHIRYTDDQGRFVWMPDLAFFHSSRMGMGRLSHWPSALKFGNFGLTGLRDFEELATFSEILHEPAKWVPELQQMQGRKNFPALTEAYLLGNHLLAATLLMGNRSAQSRPKSNDPTWNFIDTPTTHLLAPQLVEIFATAHSVKWNTSLEVSKRFLQEQVHWNRFARQIDFFMSPVHAEYLHEGAGAKLFPLNEIYGPGVKISGVQQNSFGPYREQSFSLEHGFITPDGDPSGLSLGAVNGQFPIREFEQAFWSLYLRP